MRGFTLMGLLDLVVQEIVAAGADIEIERDGSDKEGEQRSCPEQGLRAETAEGIEEEEGFGGVVEEDVAIPDETAVEEAEDHQPEVAAGVDVGNVAATAMLRAAGEQYDAGAKEHGEEAAHLAFEEEPAKKDGGEVEVRVRAGEDVDAGAGGEVVQERDVAEVLDVEDEDAEQGAAAKDVDAGDAVVEGDGLKRGRAGELFFG